MKAKRINKRANSVEKTLVPFEQRETIHPLSLFFTIVNRHQAAYFLKNYYDVGASLSMVMYAYSMPPVEILKTIGVEGTKKDIIMTVTRTEYVPKLIEIAENRFIISKAARGIAFAIPIDSVSGIAVYKFLSDHNKEVREHGQQQ